MIHPARNFILAVAGLLLLQATGRPQSATKAYPATQTRVSGQVATILTGADWMDEYLPLLKGASVAVFANQTSVIGKTHLVDTLLKRGIHIVRIFSPEHGFRGDADAGSHISSATDPATGIPIISLYGSKSKPSAADLSDVDIMLFDIQDVGVRFYTYISSLQKYIESAIANNKPLIVLDRPNPNASYIDGPVLDLKFKSFVGMQPVPVVYGMTMAEYGSMLIGEEWLDTSAGPRAHHIGPITRPTTHLDSLIQKLQGRSPENSSPYNNASAPNPAPLNIGTAGFRYIVIPCRNYTHQSRYALPVAPSPNLPNMQSVYLYPSICFFEGTAVSLGRGTGKPFQQYGHPSFPENGYSFTPQSTAGAHDPPQLNKLCNGFDLSNIDVAKVTGGHLSLQWLIKAYALFPGKDSFFLKTMYINRLAGTDTLQQQIRQNASEAAIRRSWQPALTKFKIIRKKYLLYAD